ncbi:MAG: hypothetical protein Q9167_004480 [Letrouitia subvulpina]
MAPGVGGKRKRGDRNFSQDSRDENLRPSPHRPGNLSLAQNTGYSPPPQHQNFNRDQYEARGGGRRRGVRGGRGGGSHRSPINSPVAISTQPRPPSGPPGAVSPPPIQAQPQAEAALAVPSQTIPLINSMGTQTVKQMSDPSPYFYEFVTDAYRKCWLQFGRKAVVTAGQEACQAEEVITLCNIFQELLISASCGLLDAFDAGSIVKEILDRSPDQESSPDAMVDTCTVNASSVFLDCLATVTEVSSLDLVVLQPLVLATGISLQFMRQILDSPLLESLGLIRSTFVRVGIRQQTNLLYRQSNYNLLREETEGYSKLATELFATSSGESLSSEVIEETFERVKGMVGAFDLDVGRVLDVTLDVFAAVLVKQYRFFVKYLRASSWWPKDRTTETCSFQRALSTLPKWALPGSAGKPMNEVEKEELALARRDRDREFWQRAKEIGIAAFFEIGGRRAGQGELGTALSNAESLISSEREEDRAWITVTKTLPPPGNKIAAQVLGFKLRFYSSNTRDESDVLPFNLIYLAALLIKIGFISLRDLYTHLWPAEDAMEKVRDEKTKENAEKERLSRSGGGAGNALMNAGVLTDDTINPREAREAREAARLQEIDAIKNISSKTDNPTESSVHKSQAYKDDLSEPAEQKIQLLKSLLCIGAIPESLYILGRFPWLIDAFTELPEYIHRILHYCLHKIYEPLRPLKDRSDLREQSRMLDPDASTAGKGQIKFVDAPPRKTMRWAQLDRDDTNEAIDYKFYWDDWSDSIPVCQTVDDFFVLCSTLLSYSGVKIGQDVSLLVKLCRIGNRSLEDDPSESNKARWINLSKRYLVPALSLTKRNPGAVNEVFDLIKKFSLATRYSFYAEWYQGPTSRLPDIKAAFDKTKAGTRDILKRISRTNIKPMARALAKIVYPSPGVSFQVAIALIEAYDNIAETFTECARYFTYLAYDVLSWSLITAINGGGRSRLQPDGMLTSKWLRALSILIGKVYKRYSIMSPVPIFQYVSHQLLLGNSVDLIVLEQFVASMAGIISDTSYNENQILSMSGGELLQAQTVFQVLDRRHESKITGKRLARCLVESRIGGQLLVAIAQERRRCVFNLPDEDAPSKILGNVFDEVHQILTQYLDFLRSNFSTSEFDTLVPPVADLIVESRIEPGIAFWISRPSIAAAMAEYDAKNAVKTPELKKSAGKELLEHDPKIAMEAVNSGDDVEMTLEETLPDSNGTNGKDTLTTPQNGAPEDEKSELEFKDGDKLAENGPAALFESTSPVVQSTIHGAHPILIGIMEKVCSKLPKDLWQMMSKSFYVTFWQLALGDFHVPQDQYEEEVKRLRKRKVAVNNDRSDLSILGAQRREKEKKALDDLEDHLSREQKEHIRHYTITRQRLTKDKNSWFAGAWSKLAELNTALIEYCFFPRILISPMDALYTFRIIKFLHGCGALNFRTVGVLDHFFKEKRLNSMLFLCTAREAENLGRFFNEVLRDLGRWHADEGVYLREAHGSGKDGVNYSLRGFCRKSAEKKDDCIFLGYEDFRRLLMKWHINLFKALKACFSSGEYMRIRNAINVLKSVVLHFPAVTWTGKMLMEAIALVTQTELKRMDINTAAASLLVNLKRREEDWVIPQAFNISETATNGANAARSTSAKLGTPKPESDLDKKLNPQAPSFQPDIQSSGINGTSKPSKMGSGEAEAEDGEIEDATMLDDPTATPAPKPADQPKHLQPEIQQPVLEPTPVISVPAAKDSPEPLPPPARSSGPSQDVSTADPTPHQATSDVTQSQEPPRSQPNFASHHSSVPPRSEMNSSTSSPSANGRALHSLPSRPEPTTSRPGQHRLLDRPPRDFGRDNRVSDRSQTERPGDDLREKVLDRHAAAPYPRPNDRPSERPQNSSRDRSDPPWNDSRPMQSRMEFDDRRNGSLPVNARPSTRDERQERFSRDRQPLEQYPPRDPTGPSQSTRDVTMPPPRSNIPQHPDRAALIHGNQTGDRTSANSQQSERRPDVSRHSGYSTPDRGSRGPSPVRSDDRRPPRHDGRHDFRREDRQNIDSRRTFQEANNVHPSRYSENALPSGPRTDRAGGFNHAGGNDRFRESMKPTAAAMTADPNHGRLNQDFGHGSRHSDQYARMLSTSGQDVPSGPRMPSGNNHVPPSRNARNTSAPQPQTQNSQMANNMGNLPPPPTTVDRQTSTSLAPSRLPGRDPGSVAGPDAVNSSGPPAPAAESLDTAGIHPDRLKNVQSLGSNPNPASAPSQSTIGRPHHQQPPQVSIPTPRGPASSNLSQSPSGPSPTNRGPPTGPSFGNDRSRGDKRFAGLQGVLQQNTAPNGQERSSQGASIRGRGGRPNNVGMPSPSTSGPATPSAGARADQFQSRDDLFAGRLNGSSASQVSDEDAGYSRSFRRGSTREAGREGMRDAERRPTRHYGSRSQSPGDRSMTGRLRDDEFSHPNRRGPMRDTRNIRGTGGPLPPPMPLQGLEREPPMRRGPRDEPNMNRDRRGTGPEHRDSGGWGRDERDQREGGGSGRKRGRDELGEERMGMAEKRPRRGLS